MAVKSTDKASKPVEIVPDNPNNLFLSKKDFVAQEKKRREKRAALDKFAKEIEDKESSEETKSVKVAKEKATKQARTKALREGKDNKNPKREAPKDDPAEKNYAA